MRMEEQTHYSLFLFAAVVMVASGQAISMYLTVLALSPAIITVSIRQQTVF